MAAPVAAVRRQVLRFEADGLRRLPWRDTRDPWAVLVSEVMLQQTQAARVVEAWRRFLDWFPTPAACAAADTAAVVRAWHGLGYNRRAVRLRQAAVAVVDRHGGRLPADVAALEALPGVGAYTARAVAAFAFDADVAVVDTNVRRVLSRAVAGAPVQGRGAQELADRLVPPGAGWRWNQAMIDLGATVCRASGPDCGRCPLHRCCAWRRADPPSADPWRPAARPAPFAGSDRQGRGRLVAALRRGPVTTPALAAAAGWPDDPGRAGRAAAGLVADGLARWADPSTLTLP